MDQRLLEKSHLGLHRVHVDVDPIRRDFEKEVSLGAPLLDGGDAVGLADRVGDGAVFNDAPVDEDVLRPTHRSVLCEDGDVPGQSQPGRLFPHLDQIEPLTVKLKETLGQSLDRWTLQDAPARAREDEAHLRIPKRQLGDQARDLGGLRGVRFEELPPRRHIVKQIRGLDGRPLRRPDLLDRRLRAAIDPDLGPALAAARAGPQHQVRHRRDAGQRLAPEPERRNGFEILLAPELARGMTLERQPRILRLHPFPIVFHADRLLATQLDRDRDPPSAGV